jgi:23S rRNA (adenine2503-C2)-methyltransferase
VSLHQANNTKRSALMPVNIKYPIEELIDACKYYIDCTKRRISFEWALIDGETDTTESAHELGKLIKGISYQHFDIIPPFSHKIVSCMFVCRNALSCKCYPIKPH